MGTGLMGTPYSAAYGVLLLCYGAGDVEYAAFSAPLARVA